MKNNLNIIRVVFWRTWMKTMRRPVTLTFSLLQPLMWMLFFGFLFHRYNIDELPQGTHYIDFLAAGVCAMTVMFGASQSGIELIRDMQSRFLQRLVATPAPVFYMLSGKLAADVCRLMMQSILVFALALLLGAQLHFNAVSLSLMMLGTMLFAIAFCCLSCLIALQVKSQENMATFVHVINMPLFFTSTALVPRRHMPDWLASVSAYNPLTLVVNNNRAALLQIDHAAETQLYILLVLAVLMFTACLLKFNAFKYEN